MDLPRCTTDRLSALPDDILVSILEKLSSTREAIRASVLSRRWAKLPFQLPEPEISIMEFLPSDSQLYELRAAQLSRAMESFRGAVSTFTSRTGAQAKTRCLKIEFFLSDGRTSILQRLADKNNVGALQFAIRTTVSKAECDEKLMFRYARHFHEFMAATSSTFPLLTRPELKNLWFGSDDLVAALAMCL
ncbi:hypothetical protein PR202_ga10695 [Eleusine coracana subsp. coracana]|uniref:F-box domain-containing protein n=1 Tax=Eleusine coracana subsp. coracana TaxID=191504 RepID=A0AAV5C7H5_ELECO|nr:hypothetical protein QOZ80_1AG0022050 [Eleusine coracana subsp. coracana]GJM94081.1 hypothetical protein PR202_ga10695 [Eleusine coracana subsp. coracana]